MMIKFLALVLFFLAPMCFAQVPAQCSNPVDPLETKDIPVIDTALSGFKTADTLTLVFTSKLVNNRSDATINLNQTNTASICNYQGADTQYWTRTQDNVECTESWTMVMPWAVARYQCGWIRSTENDEIVFDTDIEMTQVETLDEIRGTALTRDLITGIAAQVRFPTQIDLESDQIQVFAPVNVIAAITRQEFEADTTQGEVDLFTSVQWPFKLKNFYINSTNNNATLAVSSTDNSGCVDANVPCEQTTTTTMNPNSCFLTGSYTLYFEFECHPDFNGTCPLQGEDGRVAYEIESADLCAIFREEVDLTGTLTSFLDDYTTPRDAFLVDQTSYWKASVASSKVTIIDSQILQAYSQFNSGADVLLFDTTSGGTTAQGTSASFALAGNGGIPTDSRFFLTMTSALFPVPEDQFLPAIVKCRVAVTYQNTAKRNVRRIGELKVRLAFPDTKNGDFDTEAKIGLEGIPAGSGSDNGPTEEEKPTQEQGGSGGETPMWPIAILASLLCCGMFALFAGVVYYRRRKQHEKAVEMANNSSRGSETSEPSQSSTQQV